MTPSTSVRLLRYAALGAVIALPVSALTGASLPVAMLHGAVFAIFLAGAFPQVRRLRIARGRSVK